MGGVVACGDKRDRLEELEALVAKWKHATDTESLWVLGLLRERIDQLRSERSQPANRQGGSSSGRF